MSELTLFDLKTSKDFVEELDRKESKLVWGGYPDEGDTSGGSQSGGSTGGGETGGSTDDEKPRLIIPKPPKPPCEPPFCYEV